MTHYEHGSGCTLGVNGAQCDNCRKQYPAVSLGRNERLRYRPCREDDQFPDVRSLLSEPDEVIHVKRNELISVLAEMYEALNGDSNDEDHDALYSASVSISGWLEDPARRPSKTRA